MRLSLRQFDEVVSIASHQQATVFMTKLQNDRVGRFLREDIAQAHDLVAKFMEQVGEVLGYVVVE